MIKFEKVTDGIYLLKTPFSIVWTGITLITGDKNYLIDSGADEPEKYLIPALHDFGMELADISFLLNTHCHGDHISGHYTLKTKYGVKIASSLTALEHIMNPAENAIRIRTRFPENSPPPQAWLKGVKPDILLNDGEILDGRLRLITTPGHDSDCVCWYDIPTKTIICGDSLQANGTPTQGIGFYQDLPAYTASVEKLLLEDINNIVCGHDYDGIGSVILGQEDSRKALEYCRKRICDYDTLIRDYYAQGISDPVEIATRMIQKIGCGMPDKLFLPLYTVTEHLKRITQ